MSLWCVLICLFLQGEEFSQTSEHVFFSNYSIQTGRNSPRTKSYKGGAHSAGCLRHGTVSNAQAVRAVYLLMGGAAASSAMGYLGAGPLPNLEAKAPDLPPNTDFSGVGPAGVYHTGSPALDSPHYNSFDFVGDDSDFDTFDCGGFTF